MRVQPTPVYSTRLLPWSLACERVRVGLHASVGMHAQLLSYCPMRPMCAPCMRSTMHGPPPPTCRCPGRRPSSWPTAPSGSSRCPCRASTCAGGGVAELSAGRVKGREETAAAPTSGKAKCAPAGPATTFRCSVAEQDSEKAHMGLPRILALAMSSDSAIEGPLGPGPPPNIDATDRSCGAKSGAPAGSSTPFPPNTVWNHPIRA
jgi:hypothetical protein